MGSFAGTGPHTIEGSNFLTIFSEIPLSSSVLAREAIPPPFFSTLCFVLAGTACLRSCFLSLCYLLF